MPPSRPSPLARPTRAAKRAAKARATPTVMVDALLDAEERPTRQAGSAIELVAGARLPEPPGPSPDRGTGRGRRVVSIHVNGGQVSLSSVHAHPDTPGPRLAADLDGWRVLCATGESHGRVPIFIDAPDGRRLCLLLSDSARLTERAHRRSGHSGDQEEEDDYSVASQRPTPEKIAYALSWAIAAVLRPAADANAPGRGATQNGPRAVPADDAVATLARERVEAVFDQGWALGAPVRPGQPRPSVAWATLMLTGAAEGVSLERLASAVDVLRADAPGEQALDGTGVDGLKVSARLMTWALAEGLTPRQAQEFLADDIACGRDYSEPADPGEVADWADLVAAGWTKGQWLVLRHLLWLSSRDGEDWDGGGQPPMVAATDDLLLWRRLDPARALPAAAAGMGPGEAAVLVRQGPDDFLDRLRALRALTGDEDVPRSLEALRERALRRAEEQRRSFWDPWWDRASQGLE